MRKNDVCICHGKTYTVSYEGGRVVGVMIVDAANVQKAIRGR